MNVESASDRRALSSFSGVGGVSLLVREPAHLSLYKGGDFPYRIIRAFRLESSTLPFLFLSPIDYEDEHE